MDLDTELPTAGPVGCVTHSKSQILAQCPIKQKALTQLGSELREMGWLFAVVCYIFKASSPGPN